MILLLLLFHLMISLELKIRFLASQLACFLHCDIETQTVTTCKQKILLHDTHTVS